MSLPVFEEIPISMMSAIAEFESNLKLNLAQIFWFLKIRPPSNHKFDISVYKEGDIISAKYRSVARGYINNSKILSFPNTLSLEMLVNSRIVHFKLSKKIQITNCKSERDFTIVLEHIIKKLKFIEQHFNNKDYVSLLPYFKHDTALFIFNHINMLGSPITGEPKISSIVPIMVNRNFNLGSKINVRKFPKLISRDGFDCRHLNFKQEKMTVSYVLNTGKRVSFIIHPSGSVTLTGPNCKDIKEVYNKFVLNYSNIQKEVCIKNGL